jgi:5-methylcytosine-specific restriction enzyme subunit McrC
VALISIREYGRLHVGGFEPARPAVSLSQAAILTNLKPTYGYEVFKYVNGTTLSAQQYVGAFQLGPHTIEVLPKVDGDAVNVRRNLVAMLGVALNLDISEGDVARVALQNHGILEILIRLFCDKLFVQIHKGLVRRYEGREENLTVLRGKLGLAEQIRLNAANPERLFCRFDEFQEDNPLNQVLRAAIRMLLKVSRELRNQRQLAELMLAFEGVSDAPRASLPWTRVVFDRLSERYRPCFKLAELFLKNTPPDVTGGAAQGFSLFFDMNALFEEYIGRLAIRIFTPLGFRVTLQGPQQYLAFNETNERPAFALKPDVVGSLNSKTAWILDTKWKQLSIEEAKDGVAQSDLYQMYAYANCYRCPDVVLLYPHHKELGADAGVRGSYLLNPWVHEIERNEVRRVRVATISLENLKTVPMQLRRILLPEGVASTAAMTSVAAG